MREILNPLPPAWSPFGAFREMREFWEFCEGRQTGRR